MAVTAGALTLVSKTATKVVAQSAPATAGVGPYTYQWYRSTDPAFVPGGGNIIAGATALTLNDSGLIPGTQYYYKVVATDTGNSNATDASDALSVATEQATPNPNQVAQTTVLGVLDLRFNPNTVAAQVDASQVDPIYPGQALKMVDSAGGVPKVVACSADSDDVCGFATYNMKNRAFLAGDALEMSMSGNVMWLRAVAAIGRQKQVVIDLNTTGGVKQATGSTGSSLIGWAFDKAVNPGDLIRVMLSSPSFQLDS